MSGETIAVALSGGVDSAVAAALLQDAGHRVVGLFMRSGLAPREAPEGTPTCCVEDEAAQAAGVADALGIPLEVQDASADFDRLIDHVCDEYGRGRTPNPCVVCNRDLKFGRLLDAAARLGAGALATGHYARVEWTAGRRRLRRGLDRTKDQSYFVFMVPPARLERIRLPLGEMTKARVRRAAKKLGLPAHDRPESLDVCFAQGGLGQLIAARRPDLARPGPILDLDGHELGRHEGIVHFTIGQRRGLGVAVGEPRYVVAIRPEDAAVVIGPREALRARGLEVEECVWHETVPAEPIRAEVQVRYGHPPAATWLERGEGGRATARFDAPIDAVTPGQAAVFYRGDRVLGGGWIARSLP